MNGGTKKAVGRLASNFFKRLVNRRESNYQSLIKFFFACVRARAISRGGRWWWWVLFVVIIIVNLFPLDQQLNKYIKFDLVVVFVFFSLAFIASKCFNYNYYNKSQLMCAEWIERYVMRSFMQFNHKNERSKKKIKHTVLHAHLYP